MRKIRWKPHSPKRKWMEKCLMGDVDSLCKKPSTSHHWICTCGARGNVYSNHECKNDNL